MQGKSKPNESQVRSPQDYLEHIPRRIAELAAGREREIEGALGAGDAGGLERIAGLVNALKIEGREVPADEAEIAVAPTLAELAQKWGRVAGEELRRQVRDEVITGRVVAQLFFAGAATRFAKVAEGPLYFLDVWGVAERVLAAGRGQVPDFASDLSLEEYTRIHDAVREKASRLAPPKRARLPLGPRILFSYRAALERLAREGGQDPALARKRARFVLHVPETDDGKRILADLVARNFCGFDPAGFLVIQQTFFGGWQMEGGGVVPIQGSRSFPYGHGYSTMQLIHPGAGALYRGGSWVKVDEDALSFLGRGGDFILRTHRVNDLTQLSPASLDLDRIAAGRFCLDHGHPVVIELVANPGGQKGGNWLRLRRGEHCFLVEGMNAKADGWPDFLERHRGAPYNAFRNLYHGSTLRSILSKQSLPDHLRIRKLPQTPSSGRGSPLVGLYLEAVTGDITQIPAAGAAAFRRDEREEIHDLKELKDLPDGIEFVIAQDQDEDFRRAIG